MGADHAAEVLATPLYLGGQSERGFLGLPVDGSLPPTWLPGRQLLLRGPLGNGFRLPGNVRRLGLAALAATASRLLPLAALGLAQGADVALFADQIPSGLPASVEFQPLHMVSDSLGWMDFLALDLPREALPGLRHTLGVVNKRILPCPMQALVTSALPCAGLAACGACALPAKHGWKLICEDGPVFDLSELAW
jgi:dihydroorotate dehydrogenase electron transfer subunit